MPNIKSAKKRVLVSQAKAAQNKAARSALKTDIKKFEAAVAEGNRSEAEGAYKVAVKAVDKAVCRITISCVGGGSKYAGATDGSGPGGKGEHQRCRQ